MKKLIYIFALLPFLSFSQFDENEWSNLMYDSLYSVNKPILSISVHNNSYISDIPNLTNRSFPGHINFGLGLNYVHPISSRLNLNVNAAYNQIGANSYTSVENFKGSFVGGDIGASINLFNEKRLTPFLGIGIGGGMFNTSKDSLGAGGETYYQWDDGTVRDLPQNYQNTFVASEVVYDENYETAINNSMSYYIPLSIGASFKITPSVIGTVTYSYNIVSGTHDGIGGGIDGINQFKFSIGYKFGVKMPEPPKEDSIIIDFVVTDTLTGEPIEGATAYLWAITDSAKFIIDTAKTDQMGVAKLYYPENLNMFEASFDKEEYHSKTVDLPIHSKDSKHWKELNPIISVELKPIWEDIPVNGQVIDLFTGKPLDSVMVILYEEIADNVWQPYDTTYTDAQGNFDFVLDHKGDYKISLDKEQYKHKEFIIPDVNNAEDFQVFLDGINPYTMEPEVKKGNKFKVDNIFFAFAKADPLPESYPILDNIVKFMTENPDVRIELGAHTDCVGKEKDNMKLSNARAKSCVDYLVSKGISADRLESQGYGESQIINGCYEEGQCSTEENQVNRRVEVKVL